MALNKKIVLPSLIVAAILALALVYHQSLADWWQVNAVVVFQALVSGLFMGGIYSLIAIGFTLILGVLGIINFAQGALMVVGMYVTLWLFTTYGIDPYLSLPISVLVLFLVGALIQRFTIRPIMDAPTHNQLLLTLGITLFIVNLILVLFKADPRIIQSGISGTRMFIGEVMISFPRLVAFAGGITIATALFLFMGRTDLGKAIRASAEEREGSALVGINVKRIHLIAFGLGAACAGAAGTLMTPFFTLTPTAGDTFIMIMFAVVVLGGMGNMLGSLLGGIIIGLVESLGAVFLPGSSRLLGVFVVFILVLLFRPTGLLGKK